MKRLTFLFCFQLACTLFAAEPDVTAKKAAGSTSAPDETERNIARLVGKMLERSHYSQTPFDDAVSSKFLDRYLDTLDGMHIHFLLSDLAEFEKYRTTLDDLTLKKGDTTPAQIIFARLLQRVEQRVTYSTNLLQSEKFDFKDNDRYNLDRKNAPYPKDMAEAQKIWRQHLRYEFLEEKLSAADASPNFKVREVQSDFQPKKKENPLKAPKVNPLDVQVPKKKEPEDISKKISGRYARLLKTLRELSHDEVFEIYLTSLAHVYDPHSDYMGRSQFENFNIQMKLSLFGIGAVLESIDGYCQIKELVPGPAQKSHQLHVKDKIVAVGQGEAEPVDIVDMKLSKAVDLIRGTKGTVVKLVVVPHDAADSSVRKAVSLVRDEIKLEDQEAKAKIMEFPAEKQKTFRVGVLDLNSFYEDMDNRGGAGEHKSTSADVSKILQKLNQEKVDGLIIDLRRNGGGSLNEAIKLTGLFIKKGPVVQTKDPDGSVIVESDTDTNILYAGPLVVLTSRFSASASEILAGALQDYGRALIVGDSSTHGKGTVQSLIQLAPVMTQNGLTFDYHPGALKPTIRKFYRASGSSTQLKGVIPDVILPSVNNYAEVGEASLDAPLIWDEISSAKYDKLNWVESYLPELRKRSERRVQTDKDFAYIREDIERFKKIIADKTVGLNEEQRRKEKTEQKESVEARKKERKGRKPVTEKIYEVTLKNFDLPGLQPVAKVEKVVEEDLDPTIEPEDKTPPVDTTLEETKRILADFVVLSENEPHAVTQAQGRQSK
ncbi:MAG: carboxyl-terminal processing protease [Verrucomicrobiales bacterium]|nr:carboxyl-terminal processing protease [Verrucomicrobiales bacterium]